jgi:hypothetical protein
VPYALVAPSIEQLFLLQRAAELEAQLKQMEHRMKEAEFMAKIAVAERDSALAADSQTGVAVFSGATSLWSNKNPNYRYAQLQLIYTIAEYASHPSAVLHTK